MITHGTPPVADGGWSEFIKDFGIDLAAGLVEAARDRPGRQNLVNDPPVHAGGFSSL